MVNKTIKSDQFITIIFRLFRESAESKNLLNRNGVDAKIGLLNFDKVEYVYP